MKCANKMNREKPLIRIAVYVLIPFVQRLLHLLLRIIGETTQRLDNLGFSLAKKWMPKDQGDKSPSSTANS